MRSPRPATRPAPLSAGQKRVIASFGLTVAAVAGAIAFQIKPPVHARPAVAAAEVVSSESRVFAAADRNAKVLVSLKRGERLGVLRLPRARDEEWIEVQFVAGKKAFPPGVLKTAELGNWSSSNPEAALYLLKLFGPGEPANEDEIKDQLGKLAAFTARFGITPQGPPANLEIARLNLALARRRHNAGLPPESWQRHIDAAAVQLAMAAAGTGLGPEIQRARQDLDELTEQAEAPPRSHGRR